MVHWFRRWLIVKNVDYATGGCGGEREGPDVLTGRGPFPALVHWPAPRHSLMARSPPSFMEPEARERRIEMRVTGADRQRPKALRLSAPMSRADTIWLAALLCFTGCSEEMLSQRRAAHRALHRG